MNLGKQLLIVAMLLLAVNAFPDNRNPNLEYELISDGPRGVTTKPFNATWTGGVTTTRPPTVIKTPPPPPPDSKTFAFDGHTWTKIKKDSPPPPEDSLLWNQNNDKYL